MYNGSLYWELNALCCLKLTALLMIAHTETPGEYTDDRVCSLFYIKEPVCTNAQYELHFNNNMPEIAYHIGWSTVIYLWNAIWHHYVNIFQNSMKLYSEYNLTVSIPIFIQILHHDLILNHEMQTVGNCYLYWLHSLESEWLN
jgi:hypothetical protein